MTEDLKTASTGEATTKCFIADPVELMRRYLDGKDDLFPDEKEILMFALYMESMNLHGLAYQTSKAMGVFVGPAKPRGMST